jgi:hypothetical protein
MIMGVSRCRALELSMMQDKKLLMLHWRSFLGGGSDMVVGLFAHKGGQYCHYGLMLSRSLFIIQDSRPEIGGAPLTLISWMVQRACHFLFHTENQPITCHWIDVTMQLFDCRKDQTKIIDAPLMLHWRSVNNPLTLTSETNQQWFGAQSRCITVITPWLTVNKLLASGSGLGH